MRAAGCHIMWGGSIESREELIVNTPEKYAGLTGVEVRTGMEAVGIDAEAKLSALQTEKRFLTISW